MSHLVKPTPFRAGKTQAWPHNVLLGNKNELVNSGLTLAKGIERASSRLLKRKRLYVVRGNIAGFVHSAIAYNLVFAPRLKTKPIEYSASSFMRKTIYTPFNFLEQGDIVKNYVHARKDKVAKMRRRAKPKRLNRWITKRMFRGSGKVIWRKRSGLQLTKTAPLRFLETVGIYKVLPTNSVNFTSVKALFQQNTAGKIHKFRRGKISRRQKWRQDKLSKRRFNDKKFSYVLSRLLNRTVRVNALNLFSYLVSKRVLDFKTHQNHFWNFRYRRYRFQYKNYFDIVNAFFSVALIDNSESFLLSILKITLPLILKIRKFFKFIHSIIKYMPEIQEKFQVFKISITGKLAGGTKRTKFHSIGYGVLPVQTLSILAMSNFLSYTHIYGEFGVKLVMSKNPKYIGPKMFL